MFISWDAGIEFRSAYTFNVNLDPNEVERWDQGERGVMANLEQRTRRGFQRRGLVDPPYAFVVETRSRSGRSLTRPHLHGFAICDEPVMATTMKVALEEAFAPQLTRLGRQRSVKIDVGRDPRGSLEFIERDRWISYIIKNVHRYDKRLSKRRVFMSRSLTELAREAWAVRREE